MLTLRNRHFFVLDLVLLPCVAVLAFVLRLDAVRVQEDGAQILLFIAVAVPVKLLTFYLMGLYRRYWRYASLEELVLIATATGVSSLVAAGILFGVALPLSRMQGFPRSIPVIDAVLALLAVGGLRFAARYAQQPRQGARRQKHPASEKRVLVVGAGDAGAMIVREVQANPHLGLVPVGFLDDDPSKHGLRIHGVPVLGGREAMPEMVRQNRAAEVIIAIPSASGCTLRQLLETCREAGIPARTVPGMHEILSGQVSVSQLRPVELEDLLRRHPVETNTAAVEDLLHRRRVLVTGGGGSIGSELCRQIARLEPECLVVLGHGENSVFDLQAELSRWARCELVCAIADIRDRPRLAQVFARHRPEVVFHAAAHKHVPLAEANVCEAVGNNVAGTRTLVQVAEQFGVSHFVLISTDKAVNPTSVMGATKRVAELLVHQAAQRNGACFSAVRFGNVLGSRGSVVPIFRRQIAQGGPVTVTHPEMRRYFMTIPEAVQLVLQAAALGQGGEVFVLDMGEQVRIVDLATDLIRLSGLRPRVPAEEGPRITGKEPGQRPGEEDWDIEVVYTGLRPGEKLYEELFASGEESRRTRHEKILVAVNGHALGVDPGLDEQVERLIELADKGDEAGVRCLLHEMVPDYTPLPAPCPRPAQAPRPEELAPAPRRIDRDAQAGLVLSRPDPQQPGSALGALGRLLGGHDPAPDTDWEAVLALAREVGLAPLLYYRLAQAAHRETRTAWHGDSSSTNGHGPGAALPMEYLGSLRADFYRAVGRLMSTTQQMVEVLAALSAAGISTLVVKGPAVGASYPHPALRNYCDLDVCVPADRLGEAAAALEAAGYSQHRREPEPFKDLAQHLPPFRRDGARLSVEVHWRLDDPELAGRLPVEDLWGRAVPWTLSGQRTLRLEPVDAVLHLSKHVVVHDLARWGLKASCDVAQLTGGWSLSQWDSLAERAGEYSLVRAVYFVLLLTQELLGAAVPQEVMGRLCGLAGGGIAPERLRSFLQAVPVETFGSIDKPARGLSQAALPATLHYFLTNVFLPREVMARYYDLPAGSPRIWLAYVRRPVQLLGRYVPGLGANPAARAALRREVWLQRWLGGEARG